MLIEKHIEDGICRITLNRPDHHNTLTKELLEELSAALLKIDREASILIISGNGKSFCSGADLNALFDMNARQLKQFSVLGKKICAQLEHLHIPTIAVMHGHTLSEGIELALCCDLRIASEKTTFEFGQVRMGYTPGFGATRNLGLLIGKSRAMELLLTGVTFDAKTAHALGLVNQIFSDKTLKKKVNDLVNHLFKHDQLALEGIKQLVHSGDVIKETSLFAEQASSPDTKLKIKELLGE